MQGKAALRQAMHHSAKVFSEHAFKENAFFWELSARDFCWKA